MQICWWCVVARHVKAEEGIYYYDALAHIRRNTLHFHIGYVMRWLSSGRLKVHSHYYKRRQNYRSVNGAEHGGETEYLEIAFTSPSGAVLRHLRRIFFLWGGGGGRLDEDLASSAEKWEKVLSLRFLLSFFLPSFLREWWGDELQIKIC